MNNLEKYNKLNNSFHDKLVFRVGYFWGFFSEYNNMLLAMHYCLVHRIHFVLNSRNAIFSLTEKGWTDYFLPFTSEYNFHLLEEYNTRLWGPNYRNLRNKIQFKLYQYCFNIKYLTYDFFQTMRRNQNGNDIYNIPELGLQGTLLENCKKLHQMIWRYQPDVANKIALIQQSVNIQKPYIGFHIRQGDKYKEHTLFHCSDYISKAEQITNIRNAFVATDDYSVIEQLQQNFPQWTITTLCTAAERGYDHGTFLKLSKQEKFDSLIRLFAEMDILEQSEQFIGTFSSNIGMNMGFRLDENKLTGLDFDKWQIW